MRVHTRRRAWGYDTTHQATRLDMGGVPALERLIGRARDAGMGVILDVVFNHYDMATPLFRWDGTFEEAAALEPSFCPLNNFAELILCPAGPFFFQDAHALTPWGVRPNFDSPQVRELHLAHLRMMLRAGVAGFRFDATSCVRNSGNCFPDHKVEAISSGQLFLADAAALVRQWGAVAIAEDILSKPTYSALDMRHLGFDAEWSLNLAGAVTYTIQVLDDPSKMPDFINGVIDSHMSLHRVAYTESHDEATVVRSHRLSLVHGAMCLALPFLVASHNAPVMLFQGQEVLDPQPFGHNAELATYEFPWNLVDERPGLLALTRRLAALHKSKPALRDGNFTVGRSNNDLVAVIHRMAKDDAPIVIVIEVGFEDHVADVTVPAAGTYNVLLRTDSAEFHPEFTSIGFDQVALEADCSDRSTCWLRDLDIGNASVIVLEMIPDRVCDDVFRLSTGNCIVDASARSTSTCQVTLSPHPELHTQESIHWMTIVTDVQGESAMKVQQNGRWTVDLEVERLSTLEFHYVYNFKNKFFERCIGDITPKGSTTFQVSCEDACAHRDQPVAKKRSRRWLPDPSDGAVVELFEWKYTDVAAECSRLGKEGWSFVQIAPPVSSVVLSPQAASDYPIAYGAEFDVPPTYGWTARYEPVSLWRLHSRSGTKEELEAAATACASNGVGLLAEVVLDHMTRAPCCSGDSVAVDCTNFVRDEADAGMCPQGLHFPSSAVEVSDFHAGCRIKDWRDVDAVQACDVDGSPRLDMTSPRVRIALTGLLNELLDYGVSGFQVVSAGLIGAENLAVITDSLHGLRDDIKAAVRIDRPLIAADVWPSLLLDRPDLQPETLEDVAVDLTAGPFVERGNFVPDHAWALVAAEVWEGMRGLKDFTEMSIDGVRFAHERWRMSTNDVNPQRRRLRNLNNQYLNAFAFKQCSNFNGDVCSQTYSSAVATAWMMALPQSLPRVFSSYSWYREFYYRANGLPRDRYFWTGPPRAGDGKMTAKVECGHTDDYGVTWVCEHRNPEVAAMPAWRRTVAGSTSLLNLEGGQSTVSFSRSVNRKGRSRRAGWVAFSRSDAGKKKRRTYDVGLPPGSYRDGTTGRRIRVDTQGRLTIRPPKPGAAIIIHTGDADLDSVGFTLVQIWTILAVWITLPFLVFFALRIRWHSRQLLVLQDRGVSEREHNSTQVSLDASIISTRESSAVGSDEQKESHRDAGPVVMLVSLEHVVPAAGIKVTAGGLGKVVALYVTKPVMSLISVFPKVSGVDYSAFVDDPESLQTRSGEIGVATLYDDESKVTFVALDHPVFAARTKEAVYPSGEDPDCFLKFFALWCECVALLFERFDASLLHALDYHSAFAPWIYYGRNDRLIPTALTLHNVSSLLHLRSKE